MDFKEFSSIAQLFEDIKEYAIARYHLERLTLIEKLTALVGFIVAALVVTMLAVTGIFILALSLGLYIGTLLDSYALGMLVAAAFICILATIAWAAKHALFVRPLANLLLKSLMQKEKSLSSDLPLTPSVEVLPQT